MANRRERLQLTLRKRKTGRVWDNKTLDVTEDPDDHEALLEHLEAMVRDLDRRTGRAWWIGEYELLVFVVARRRKFSVVGRAEG